MAKRTERIRIRLTKAELEYLKKNAETFPYSRFRNGRGNFSDYLRTFLLENTGCKNKELSIQMRELRYEMRKIGTNVNQIAKKINGGFGTPGDLRELNRNLAELNQSVQGYQEEARKAWQSPN